MPANRSNLKSWSNTYNDRGVSLIYQQPDASELPMKLAMETFFTLRVPRWGRVNYRGTRDESEPGHGMSVHLLCPALHVGHNPELPPLVSFPTLLEAATLCSEPSSWL